MVYSRIDQFYRSLLLSKFFTKGWGKPDNLKRIFEFRKILSNRDTCQTLVENDYPITIDKVYKDGDIRVMEGHFQSPFVRRMPGIMPKEVETASFQIILPLEWQHTTLKPICLHLAGTGDHFFWRRRLFTARPLLKEAGIASILLENPYYGSRKPKSQFRSSLHNVSDLFVMGGALVLESIALLRWCEKQGWGPFGLSGVSMGGHMASLAATNWSGPITLVPCLSWSTASCVFTQGVMSGAIPWQVLQEQFFKNNLYHEEISKLIVSPEKAYQMGQNFVINYSQDLEKSNASDKENISQESLHDDLENRQRNRNNNSLKATILNVSQSLENNEQEVLCVNSSSTSMPSSLPFDKASHNENELSANTLYANANNSNDPSSVSSNKKEFNESQKIKPAKETRRLSLNYAKTKQSQQSTSFSGSKEKKPLTFKHAVAKSKLLFSSNTQHKENEHMKKRNLQEESYEFMRGVMDECTHLGNFSIPVDPELVIIVSATQDAYIPRDGVTPLDKLWPGCEVRYVDKGHVGAVLLHQDVFRKALTDAFDKQIKKYHPNEFDEMKLIRRTSRKS